MYPNPLPPKVSVVRTETSTGATGSGSGSEFCQGALSETGQILYTEALWSWPEIVLVIDG
ncbi:MAG: hypothetical protein AMXMBFR82_24000 [Candidatus Hydrogenedentota bacterium]